MKVVIIGAGPSGLFAALKLLEQGHEVHLYEKGSGIGKKLLIAGKSGLNITHSELTKTFKDNYFAHEELFNDLLTNFSNQDLIKWIESLGIETFVGTSGRVFPKTFKAADLVAKILTLLNSNQNFHLHLNHELTKINISSVVLNSEEVNFDRVIYALGGASWSKLGTDGKWKSLFEDNSILVNDFYAMNCGFEIQWSEGFCSENFPIKNIEVSYKDNKYKGDLMLTRYGVEGTPIYSLSYFLQKDLKDLLYIEAKLDLKPDLSIEQVLEKLKTARSKDSLSNTLRKKLNLTKEKTKLIRELTPKGLSLEETAYAIKSLTLKINKSRPIDEAISTGGGIDMKEVDEKFQLKKLPNHYAVGEMLDWVAPTGGYLLQACFSQAYRVTN